MHTRLPAWARTRVFSAFTRLFRPAGLLLPAFLLFLGALRSLDHFNVMLWLGAGFQVVVCLLAFFSVPANRQGLGPSLVTLYIIALGWLWLGTTPSSDWYPDFAKAVLLVVPLLVFSLQVLVESGAPAVRRARRLADRLAERKDWPADLAACRTLPEVKALREAIQRDASPALALLSQGRVEVQLAALATLEFRKDWRPGQAEIVLLAAQRAAVPTVRAAAVAALGNLDERLIIEALAEFLRDPSWEVRRAATEALLWDTEHRWPWIRQAVRRCLADLTCADDGPLRHEGQMLTAEAVADVTAWAAQKGLLGQRPALTLGLHYARALAECPSDELVREMQRQVASLQTPASLRIELARLLYSSQALDRPLLEALLTVANPAPLRLLAAEALLLVEDCREEIVAVLCQLARLPNREIAVNTADVVQHHLGVDLGLALGKPLPPIYTRQAAEVARRVLIWACQEGGRNQRSVIQEKPSTL